MDIESEAEVELPNVGIDIPAVSQIAWVVEDVEAAMERYNRVLGFGPWEVHRIEPPEHREMSYRGAETECAFEIGYATLGDVEIEFVEPLSGESIHQDFLEAHGEGVHHLACFESTTSMRSSAPSKTPGYPWFKTGSGTTDTTYTSTHASTLTGCTSKRSPAEKPIRSLSTRIQRIAPNRRHRWTRYRVYGHRQTRSHRDGGYALSWTDRERSVQRPMQWSMAR
ncbi:VOC family protein [Natronococcus roseus]|uniref:VOC family protein n=1 Tax=Natronococcus roseus TaxID=1052014 RepID=UPI00374D7210